MVRQSANDIFIWQAELDREKARRRRDLARARREGVTIAQKRLMEATTKALKAGMSRS